MGQLVKLIWLKVNEGIKICFYPCRSCLNILSILVATTSGTATTTTTTTTDKESTYMTTTIQSPTPGSSTEHDHVLGTNTPKTNAFTTSTSTSNFVKALSIGASCLLVLFIILFYVFWKKDVLPCYKTSRNQLKIQNVVYENDRGGQLNIIHVPKKPL